eukprot:gene10498-11629_t
MEPTFQWSTNGYKDQEKSDHSITQDVGNNSQWDWDWTMSELPDYCFHLAHSYINRQIDLPGSRIVMKIASRGTAVKHNMIAVQGIDKKRYLIPCFVLDGLVKAGLVDVNDMSIEEHPFDAQHMEMNLAGETIFWLDNNHRIYHIEAHGGVSLRYCRCDC